MLLQARPFDSRRIASMAAALLLAGGTLSSPTRAQEGADYTIAEEDGYGIGECMRDGSACGRVIADSWCESHGHAHALSFGLKSDVTGSIATPPVTPVATVAAETTGDAVVIRCGD